MIAPNETHDVHAVCWIEGSTASDFPVQNLPWGVFSPPGDPRPRVGVAIGNQILEVAPLVEAGLLTGDARIAGEACVGETLNPLMALGTQPARALRSRLFALLTSEAGLAENQVLRDRALWPQSQCKMHRPAAIGDYTDFYASVHHATNVGSMFRPDNPLLPNYKHIPVGYHGRASSVVVSGTDIVRPSGQTKADDADAPTFGPCRLLDYEMEVGFFVSKPNRLGSPIALPDAEDHIFGLCLVNDWSARDIQKWEYVPLGPFLAKNFATTVSPWVVTLDALAPFRCAEFERDAGDPRPLAYLQDADNAAGGGIDLQVEVHLRTARMVDEGNDPHRLSRGNFRDMYWTVAQMLTHHTSNGCNAQSGDLLASGTVSGPTKHSRGSMLELSWRGTEPIQLPNGEERKFLQDGDEVTLRGYCERDGFARIGLGDCVGTVRGA